MNGTILLAAILLLHSEFGFSEECTKDYFFELSTDPTQKKSLSGDANAAYGLYTFRGDPGKKLIIRGEFPFARFTSITTEETQREHNFDSILDYMILPDVGSSNPFVEGNAIDASPRSYTIEAVPEGLKSSGKNVVKLPQNRKVQHIMVRIYSPNKGIAVTKKSFPRIFAYDASTNQPTSCPKHVYHDSYLHLPQFIVRAKVSRQEYFNFQEGKTNWGPNVAIPVYLWGGNYVRQGSEVTLVRFKAPHFVDTRSNTGTFDNVGDTRYFSFCAQNFVNNQTLGCIPDYLAKPDGNGIVTVVFGRGNEVRKFAEKNNYNFLNDNRERNQRSIVFLYRNLLPKEEFLKDTVAQKQNTPAGVLCSASELLNGICAKK